MPEVVNISRDVSVLAMDARWDAGAQTALASRVKLAVLPLVRGRLTSREHVVMSNQPVTPEGTISLGTSDDIVRIALGALASDVEAVSVLAFMQPRANAGKPSLDILQRLTVTWRDDTTGAQLGHCDELLAQMRPVPAAEIARLSRTADGWQATHAVQGFEAGLAGALMQLGVRL